MATDASDTTAPRPAPPAPPARKPRARGRSDEAGPSNVDSMDHDDEHRGGLSEEVCTEAPEKRRRAIACDAPPGAAQVTRARAAALPPDACTDAPVHARTPAQLAVDCAVGQAAATASAAQIEHSTSAAQQPTAQVWPLSAGRCARPTQCARSTGLRPGYGCSPAVTQWIRIPALRSSSQL